MSLFLMLLLTYCLCDIKEIIKLSFYGMFDLLKILFLPLKRSYLKLNVGGVEDVFIKLGLKNGEGMKGGESLG